MSCMLQTQFHIFQIFFPGKQLNSFELSFPESALHLRTLTCEFTDVTLVGFGCGFWRGFLALVFWIALKCWNYSSEFTVDCGVITNGRFCHTTSNFPCFSCHFSPSFPPKYDQRPRFCFYLFFIFYFPFLQSLALINRQLETEFWEMCSALLVTVVTSFLLCDVCPAVSNFGSVIPHASSPVCKRPVRGHCFGLLVHCFNTGWRNALSSVVLPWFIHCAKI